MIKTATALDKDVQKCLLSKNKIIWLVINILSLLCGVLAFILRNYTILILCLIMVVASIMMLINFKKMILSANGETKNNYEFFNEYFAVESVKNGEIIGTSKLKYTDLYKIKLTKNYIFLYINKVSVYPIKISNLTKDEQNTLKQFLNL